MAALLRLMMTSPTYFIPEVIIEGSFGAFRQYELELSAKCADLNATVSRNEQYSNRIKNQIKISKIVFGVGFIY